MHFSPKSRHILPPCDADSDSATFVVLLLFLRVCQAKKISCLSLSLSLSFFYCSPMKNNPGQAEKNEKASSLIG